jgi:hypothetical protein
MLATQAGWQRPLASLATFGTKLANPMAGFGAGEIGEMYIISIFFRTETRLDFLFGKSET